MKTRRNKEIAIAFCDECVNNELPLYRDGLGRALCWRCFARKHLDTISGSEIFAAHRDQLEPRIEAYLEGNDSGYRRGLWIGLSSAIAIELIAVVIIVGIWKAVTQ